MLTIDCEWEATGSGIVCKRCGRRSKTTSTRANCKVQPSQPQPQTLPQTAPQTTPEVKPFTLGQKAAGFVGSMMDFAKDGLTLVDADEYARRLAICDQCENKTGGSCRICGCQLKLKAKGRAFHCPIQKW